MPSDIQQRKLLVISDSPVCRQEDGALAGYEPVVRELEALTTLFGEITWLACKVKTSSYAMRVPPASVKIVAMPSVLDKNNLLRSFFLYPAFFLYILKYLPQATHLHTRAPSHPALLGIIVSMFLPARPSWHKYAGNWIANGLAMSYKSQRALISQVTTSIATVNGKWPGSPLHILAFENPCLTNAELQNATQLASTKDFSGALDIIFVGNLVEAKGILQLLEALGNNNLSQRYRNVYIIGDGELKQQVVRMAGAITNVSIHVLGLQQRTELNKLYATAHIVILPSRSEGFPKVIAEAAAYGCVPVVTDISAISQYIRNNDNGYLLKDNSRENIYTALTDIAGNAALKEMSDRACTLSKLFTYERFVERVKNEVYKI